MKFKFKDNNFELPIELKTKFKDFLGIDSFDWPSVSIVFENDYDEYDNSGWEDTVAYYNEEKNVIKIIDTFLKFKNGYWIIPDHLLYHETVHAFQYKCGHWNWKEYILSEAIAEIVSGLLSNKKLTSKNYNNYFDYIRELDYFWKFLEYILKLDDSKKIKFIKEYLINKKFYKEWFGSKKEFYKIQIQQLTCIKIKKLYYKNNIIKFINSNKF